MLDSRRLCPTSEPSNVEDSFKSRQRRRFCVIGWPLSADPSCGPLIVGGPHRFLFPLPSLGFSDSQLGLVK